LAESFAFGLTAEPPSRLRLRRKPLSHSDIGGSAGNRHGVGKARGMESALTPDAAAAICRHMNEDHGDAVAAYARSFGNVADVRAAELISFDAQAMQLGVETDGGRIVTRIPFDHVLADKDDARNTLIAMARDAMREP
jgi:putative heme iron utilization protein